MSQTHALTQGIASLGRGPDTTLVHMSQPEVDALQQIAKAQGGSLTINPQTGLPEAGFLSSALPIIGTVAGSMMGMPWLGAAMSGLGTAMATGDIGKGILSGLGSWGMGQAFGAMAGAGANPMEEATKQAVTQSVGNPVAANAVMQGINPVLPGEFGELGIGATNPAMVAANPMTAANSSGATPYNEFIPDGAPYNEFAQTTSPQTAANPYVAAQQIHTPYETPESVFTAPNRNLVDTSKMKLGERVGNVGSGFGQLGSETGRDNIMGRMANGGKYNPDASILGIKGTEGMGNAATLGAAGLGAYNTVKGIGDVMNPQRPGLAGLPIPPGMTRQQYDFAQRRNPNWGQPGQAYFDQRFSPVQAAGGGLMMSQGGPAYPQDTPNYPLSGVGSQYAQGIGPTPSEMIGGSGDTAINKYGEEAKRMNTGGNVIPGKPRKSKRESDSLLPYEQSSYNDQKYMEYLKRMGDNGPLKVDEYDDPSNDLAAGGVASLGTYKAGGLLNGPGDGVSDSIPAVINGPKPQRAALADGEFVIPARIVSEIGNGSTKAGSKRLYAMMDRIEKARKKVKNGQDSGAYRMLPA